MLIKKHGEDALLHAAARHIELWHQGAFTGARVWNRIYNAVLDAQQPELIETPNERDQH